MIEQNTNYAFKLKHMTNPTFDKVRDLSTKFYRELPQPLQDELFEALNRGIDILDSEPQLNAYLFAFGKMHKAKLNYAFEHLPETFFEIPEINIIDYGCGQAVATMCYADFLRKQGFTQKIKRVTLIEPSEMALKRAALHVSVFFAEAEIVTINKGFDNLRSKDIVCDEDVPTLHLLSNVLDMDSYNFDHFTTLIKKNMGPANLFVCVGPYFGDSDRSWHMDDFANNLMEDIIYTVDLNSFEFDPNYSWTCMVRCFGVGNLGIDLHKEKAGTVNSNVKPLFINFLTYKGMRRVFLVLKENINPMTNQKEQWQELVLGTSMDDPNAEIIRISSELGTINASFLIRNKDILQVFSHPNYKHKILCIEDRPESTLRENLSTEVTDEAIENGIEDEFGVVYSRDGKRLLKGKEKYKLSEYSIKKGTKVIGNNAFEWCVSLQSIVIPDSVTSIGNSAFGECKFLKSVVIPDSVTSIGDYAFFSCESLQSIDIPNSVTSIGPYAFSGCKFLKSINIPNSVTSIGAYAFGGCKSLKSIVIPDSVTILEDLAFECCESLQSIIISNSVTSIGNYAFRYCESLQSIIIPNSVTSIGDRAFYYCKSLQSIIIPNSVTSIGEGAFLGCESLKSIIIPNSVKSIGENAFSQCTSLLSIIIPNSITSIGDYAFSECYSLQSVVIPNSVTNIGHVAFGYCDSLQSIAIPNSVTCIGDAAFTWCRSLQSIIIPDGVTIIGKHAFNCCDSLQSIIIPKGRRAKFRKMINKELWDKLVEE